MPSHMCITVQQQKAGHLQAQAGIDVPQVVQVI